MIWLSYGICTGIKKNDLRVDLEESPCYCQLFFFKAHAHKILTTEGKYHLFVTKHVL